MALLIITLSANGNSVITVCPLGGDHSGAKENSLQGARLDHSPPPVVDHRSPVPRGLPGESPVPSADEVSDRRPVHDPVAVPDDREAVQEGNKKRTRFGPLLIIELRMSLESFMRMAVGSLLDRGRGQ